MNGQKQMVLERDFPDHFLLWDEMNHVLKAMFFPHWERGIYILYIAK